jgi:hypothetical protein
MSYSAEINRGNPSCFLFLIDQSSSMAGPFAGQTDKSKAQGVADALNRLLQNLILKCAKSEGIRDYFYVGILGYASQVTSLLTGELAGRTLVPVSVVANHPLRVEERTRKVDDGAGGLVEQRFKFPVWVTPAAGGKTVMCQALTRAAEVVQEYLRLCPNCFPPVVINVSDGKATDGDPREAAKKLQALDSTDGNVLLFNVHLSSTPGQPIEFPSREEVLSAPYARLLFRMSSPLPRPMREAAEGEGYAVHGTPRGFVFNADLVSVVRFLDIGTRVSPTGR